MRERAHAKTQRLATFAIDTEVGFERPADLERFTPRDRRRIPQTETPGEQMTDQPAKPFRIEVVVEAPRDVVWRALTDPGEIRRWFGWDYDGLEEEIRFIFVDHARPVEPDRIELEDGGPGQTIELEADGPRTTVRVVRPGPLGEAGWDELYDDMEEGWHMFFQQLRHYLERHRGEDRRTLFLSGEARPSEVLVAVESELPGERWYHGRHQCGIATEELGGGLAIVVAAAQPLDSSERGRMSVTLTSYGLDDEAFAAARGDWEARWAALAEEAKVSP
jgi:uncharacterized protein YndB with AHSA1/START domain